MDRAPSPAMIVGIVVGCLVAVCCIASIIFCVVVQQKKRDSQVLLRSTRLMVVSAQPIPTPEPLGYASVKPLTPGYASPYQPPYSPGQSAGGHIHPPPPYSYTTNHQLASTTATKVGSNN